MNPRRLSRRAMMRCSAAALLAADFWPGRAFAADAATEAFDFIVINDLHYMTPACGAWLEKVVASMKAQKAKPEFCFINGDVTDKGSPAASFAAVRDVFKGLGVPVHTVPGNHDYVKGKDRRPYEEIFAGRTNYVVQHKGWQIVALDSTEGTLSLVEIQKPTLDFVDANLPKLDKDKPTLLITHFPLGPGVNMRAKNADALLDRFKGHNLAAVFNGHYHASTSTTLRDIPIRTNKCCSLKKGNHDNTKEKGYFVVTAKDGKVTPTFVEVPQG